jgi:CheY-like chemotaxis protein
LAVYNFDRINIFLVEDNPYIRDVLESLLRHLRFANVYVAPNGAEAIEYFQDLKRNRAFGEIDIILSDLVMTPLNGLLLLRWIRTAKESPNRFMPFVMLSGAADHEYVKAARDLGVTEFMAKPFSVASVSRYLLQIIDRPRQFVATQKYFGPDRRRKSSPPATGEQRVTEDKDVSIVYSTEKVVKPKNPSEVWCFRLNNRLKEKVGGGAGAGEPGELPLDILLEAEEQLERSVANFADWARDYLKQLSKLCENALSNAEGRVKVFEDINLLAHELRGQGGTFGYPLISQFGTSLYSSTRQGCGKEDKDVEVVKAHIDSMRAVLREQVTGDGGEIGQALLSGLEAAIKRHSTAED